MNGPTFNIGYDPILSNPFPQMVDYSKEIDERVQYLQAMKERMSNTVQPANNPNNSLWSAIDSEIGSLNDEQRNILFSDAKYIQIDNQLKQLIQEALINSVKNVIEQSPNGKELLTQQLNYVKSSKNAIIAESNKKLELFEKFQIAAKALSLITDEKGMVDGDGLLNDMIDRLIVSKANTINGVTIGEGSIKVTIPFMNKTVIFDKDDFNELKTNIEKYGKSE